jgi:hypothetical protein
VLYPLNLSLGLYRLIGEPLALPRPVGRLGLLALFQAQAGVVQPVGHRIGRENCPAFAGGAVSTRVLDEAA